MLSSIGFCINSPAVSRFEKYLSLPLPSLRDFPLPPMSFSTIVHSLALSVILVFIAYATLKGIYNIFLHPLSGIPGPWYAAASDFWLTVHVVRLEQCKVVQSLFEKYGPVVRVGPNKVFFNDMSSTRSIYSVHKFDKSEYYKSLLTYVCLVSFINSELAPDKFLQEQ